MTVRHLVAEETQRPNEAITRQIDTTNWGGSPTSPTDDCKAVDEVANTSTDASSKLSGTATVNGNNVILRKLSGLVDGITYHHIAQFTVSGGEPVEVYYIIHCTDDRPPDA